MKRKPPFCTHAEQRLCVHTLDSIFSSLYLKCQCSSHPQWQCRPVFVVPGLKLTGFLSDDDHFDISGGEKDEMKVP